MIFIKRFVRKMNVKIIIARIGVRSNGHIENASAIAC
jgi:hypothetical protein